MARTRIHKEKGKFNNGIDDDNVSTSLRMFWRRHNYDLGEHKHEKNKKRLKQLDRDTCVELNY